jgi:hypothetical protein
MVLSKREIHLLWMVLCKPIQRYLLVYNIDSSERASLHILISKIICHYVLSDGGCHTILNLDDEHPMGYIDVHNWIQRNITDTIGLELNNVDCDGRCSRKFFDIIIGGLLNGEIEQIIQNPIESINSRGLFNGYGL